MSEVDWGSVSARGARLSAFQTHKGWLSPCPGYSLALSPTEALTSNSSNGGRTMGPAALYCSGDTSPEPGLVPLLPTRRYNDLGAAVMAIAGHDLRQPLQVIIMAHDALARTLLDGAERAQLTRIERSVMVLAGTLDRLVEVLQLQETSCRDSHAPVSLLPIFADLESEFMEPAQLKGIKLRIIPTHAVVSSHPVLLGAMLRNLIRNAIQYTPFGGRVLVGCRRRGAELHIEVRDSGIGLVPSQLSMICRAFHRVDTTRADGLGLGLFIVERAAKFLGHRVEIRSAPGRGSCFVVVVVAERSFAQDS